MFRLKKHQKGWIVEVLETKRVFIFFIKKTWKPYTHYTGLPDNPFYCKTPEAARDVATQQIKDEIHYSFFQ